jgi:hypothetical protein
MKTCTSCGASNADDAAFCELCLTRFDGDARVAREHGADPSDSRLVRLAPGEVRHLPRSSGTPLPAARQSRLRWVAVRVAVLLVPVVLVLLVVLGFRFANRIPDAVASAERPVPMDINAEPVQTAVEDQQPLSEGPGGARVLPLAEYTISGKALGVKINRRYGEGDGLFPIDLALAWGLVAVSDYDRYLDYGFDNVWIYNQWLEYRVDTEKLPEGISTGYITSHISNNHIFPANENIYDAVAHIGKGREVLLAGYLVSATEPNGRTVVSSLTRTDAEAGACECFYVTRVQAEGKVYR